MTRTAMLQLENLRCPVVMQKIMLATQSLLRNDDWDQLLISTIEMTAERDTRALLERYPNLILEQVQVLDNTLHLLLKKTPYHQGDALCRDASY